MQYHEHKKYFEVAYKNGADIWTHLPIEARGEKLTERLKMGSYILDIGSGRGLFAKQLADNGYKVVGIDFEKNIVEKANSQIKDWGLFGKLKFIEADVLDIPLTDESFDGICDFGLLENLYHEDWEQYANEITRVLKPGGFYLNVSLSRETQKFFEFNPKNSLSGEFQKYGVHYHFFDKEEMEKIFAGKLKIISQENKHISQKPADTILLETLFQK
ncbi:MAG TPA: class I SAM-dependent methyltransferase [Candidatus Paceibacterota bacterium]|nr:class I SAM-dependent methyltransferase [Candidatus Paceibacterota bacterium]HPT18031.1 class I SAM-dependent methyltransferase [Candidatus Paceibacterota bacterium]